MKRSSWFIFALFFAASCLDDPDCFQLNNDVVGITFRALGSSTPDTLSVKAVSINGLYVSIAKSKLPYTSRTPGDTLLTYFGFLADRFIDYSNLRINSRGVEKEIDLNYKVQVQFVSQECGPRYVLSDLKAVDHNFDSVAIVNGSPGRNSSSVNVIIYRCPRTDTLGVRLWQLLLPETGRGSPRAISAPFNSITAEGMGELYTDARAATLKLPVNLNAASTSYTFDLQNDFGYEKPVREFGLSYRVTEVTPYGETCPPQKIARRLALIQGENAFDSISFALNAANDTIQISDPITTNVNIYRCPPTNIIQLAFVQEGTTSARSKAITSITADYTPEVFASDVSISRIQLPLNENANSTTFTIVGEDFNETVTFNYTWSAPRATLFKPGFACSDRRVITDLSVASNENATVVKREVLYPAVNNVNVEVPQ